MGVRNISIDFTQTLEGGSPEEHADRISKSLASEVLENKDGAPGEFSHPQLDEWGVSKILFNNSGVVALVPAPENEELFQDLITTYEGKCLQYSFIMNHDATRARAFSPFKPSNPKASTDIAKKYHHAKIPHKSLGGKGINIMCPNETKLSLTFLD